MEEIYKKQIKILNELYDLLAKELEIVNKIIDMSMTDEDYKKYREIAIEILEKEEEES